VVDKQCRLAALHVSAVAAMLRGCVFRCVFVRGSTLRSSMMCGRCVVPMDSRSAVTAAMLRLHDSCSLCGLCATVFHGLSRWLRSMRLPRHAVYVFFVLRSFCRCYVLRYARLYVAWHYARSAALRGVHVFAVIALAAIAALTALPARCTGLHVSHDMHRLAAVAAR
jgi:hypothetical protein